MNKSKFAMLDQEQIQELKQLEEKLEVTLLAYDQSINENNHLQNQNEDSIG
ncbi:uroporphyrinogen-III decarboxylase [Lysinibacillus sp. SGAir0095]|uniref:uroporphyrinogen-III decarboxylase n=1 Tax=Lysinibacillus sp. SGAir0095 TaxID=2070463 RepID=UPI0010CD2EC2|nr:uroporphyrinogen-III decarboxylase [Lysinibacillus sp. SGAir0095]QCR31096.1 uroporphyrinogen-III decarboxylase [Lysinibacillus sp. SGAir0095]